MSVLDAWSDLVDPRVGVVRKVSPLRTDDDEPRFFHYLSTACDTGRFTYLSNFNNTGGVSVDRRGAIAKALGEAIERYCSAIFDYRDLTLGPYDELDGAATPPERFALHSAEQYAQEGFPWRPFTRSSPVCWTRGASLVSGEPVLAPACMVYVPFHFLSSRPDTPICQPISTGLACGSGWEQAVLSGLCEAVERDAFTLTWQARCSWPHVARESWTDAIEDRVRRYEDVGLRVEMMEITTDVAVPVILTVALGDSPTSPAVAVAAACDPSPEVAAIKSLEELAHTRKFARQLHQCTPPVPVDVAGGHPEVVDQKTHLRFYCEQEAKEHAGFMWASRQERPLGDEPPVRSLEGAVAAVAAAGLEPVVVDLTTPDVATLGLTVVRVVVPGLNPLFMGHRNRALGGERLRTVPQLLGHRGLAPGEPDNPYPHPFP
jgi:ribosomal protein S12 methylthiotransferase accessory factor